MIDIGLICTLPCFNCGKIMSHATLEVSREHGYDWKVLCCGHDQSEPMDPDNTDMGVTKA